MLEAARALGLRTPADLSVVGYDDVAVAQWSRPALTTVRQPLRRMAEEASRMILRLRAAPSTTSTTRMELATSLVIRRSTAPPP